jgi:hypothetical protein
MTNEPSSECRSDKAWIIEAVCINCNKRFNSTRAVSMHLKATAARHAVSFINHGNYNKKTGPREMNPLEFASLSLSDK